ncbi:hypothetical protein VKT23_003490 [Stygiomarasmius scandens]|uniref:Uncharacterized protein n=1 Tax=Marasmiellus scandens TaxID=2682957 RepID=A0ABR1K342_9AGAR
MASPHLDCSTTMLKDFQVTDCVWRRTKAVDAYTHLRLLKNGWKSHNFKTSFAKHSTGGSTGWQFRFDSATKYSIELYTSSQNIPLTRRIGMDAKEYETKILTLDDFIEVRDIEDPNGPISASEATIACDIKMALGTITLHIVAPKVSLRDHLNKANMLVTIPVSPILQCIEKLEPVFEPLSTISDVIGDIHPLVKGIVGSFRTIHNVLRGISQLNREIGALLEEMCTMLRHLDKIKSCMKSSEAEDLRLILLKMESVMSNTCEFVQNWHENKKRKGSLLASLSREQTQGIKRLQAQFSEVKSDLDRGLVIDTFVRTRVLSDNLKLDLKPFPSVEAKVPYRKDDPPSYDLWGMNPRAAAATVDFCVG